MTTDTFEFNVDDSTFNFYPIRNYAANLDDLENVDGFNKPGKKDQLYGFKLNENRLYERSEILSSALDHGGIENKLLTFVYDSIKKKIIILPLKYNWDIDIKLKTSKLFTGGINHHIHKIYNSGTIIGALVPQGSQQAVLKVIEGRYYISSRENKETHLEFKTEFDEDKKLILELPVGSSIVIEGMMMKENKEAKEILPGLLLGNDYQPRQSIPAGFKIVLIKTKDLSYGIKHVTAGLQITKPADKKLEIMPLKIYDFYCISRFRITTGSVTDDEIKYL